MCRPKSEHAANAKFLPRLLSVISPEIPLPLRHSAKTCHSVRYFRKLPFFPSSPGVSKKPANPFDISENPPPKIEKSPLLVRLVRKFGNSAVDNYAKTNPPKRKAKADQIYNKVN